MRNVVAGLALLVLASQGSAQQPASSAQSQQAQPGPSAKGLKLLLPDAGPAADNQGPAKTAGNPDPNPEAAATPIAKTGQTRAEIYNKSATAFLKAIGNVPEGFVDLTKEKLTWDAAEQFLLVLSKECEQLLRSKKQVADDYALAQPAFADTHKALLKVKIACEKDVADVKTDRERENAILWLRFVEAAVLRNGRNAADAKAVFREVERYSVEAEQDLRNWKKGLEVVRLVRIPLQKSVGLAELHAQFREYQKRRDRAKGIIKSLLEKLEKSSTYPTPPVANPPVSKTVVSVPSSGASAAVGVVPVSGEKKKATVPAKSEVTVFLPAEARLWVTGSGLRVEYVSGSPVRSFTTPALRPGRYAYVFRMDLVREGRLVSESRRGLIIPGQPLQLNFNSPELTIASR